MFKIVTEANDMNSTNARRRGEKLQRGGQHDKGSLKTGRGKQRSSLGRKDSGKRGQVKKK